MNPASNTHSRPETTLDIERRVHDAHIDILFRGTTLSIGSLLTVAVVFVNIMAEYYPLEWLLGWLALLTLSAVPRLLLVHFYLKAPSTPAHPDRWLWAYRASICTSGLVLGSTAILFWDGATLTESYAFVLAIIVGLSAGILVTVRDSISSICYVSLLVGPLTLRSLLSDDPMLFKAGLLELAMLFIFIRFGRDYQEDLTKSFRLQLENINLLKNLREEKQQLDNRLGRVLSNSSNEIYVIDANNLRFLQVNPRALQNLGYDEESITRLRLPNILADLNEAQLRRLLAPMIEGKQDSIFHQGRHVCSDGRSYPVEIRFQYSPKDMPPIIVATALDTSERLEYEERLRQQATKDQLTCLPNRHFIVEHIATALETSQRSDRPMALLFLDLDNFKSINDSLGHSAGDSLLREAAQRIQSVLRKSDTAARLGGDEFLVLLEDIDSPEDAKQIAERLVAEFLQPFEVNGRRIHSTTSVGIAIYPGDGDSVETLMQSADTAMYKAKQLGRSGFQFFSAEMRAEAEEHMVIASHLSRALSNDEISLVYQPIVEVRQGQETIVGAEALVRWSNSELGRVPPDRFIPIAESLGLIQDIGQYVLDRACREATHWPVRPNGKPRFVSINVSSRQFRNGNLLGCVDEALANSGLSTDTLKLEITESLLIQDSHNPLRILTALRERGIQLALDDFGTGYSSLSYLKKFPLQLLKIDRAFINDIGRDKNDEVLVSAIIAMAKSLGLQIVAEGVETDEQLAFLRQRDVGLIQGYYFSPPVTGEEFHRMLEAQTAETEKSMATA